MTDHAHLSIEIRDCVAIATLEHRPANTRNRDMLTGLEFLIADLEARPSIRCLILTGSGERFFSAGADLHQFRGAFPDDVPPSYSAARAASVLARSGQSTSQR